MQSRALPRPLEVAVRLLIVGAAVLWLSHTYERALVGSMLPFFRETISLLSDDFTILGMEIAREGPNETVQVKANFSRPVFVGGRLLYPMGWTPETAGWMQINLTLGSVLQYSLLTLILVLAWPVSGVKEFALRIAIALPLAAILLLIDAPLTILAELWFPAHNDFAPDEFWPLLAWSRFLMGGGGLTIALLMAVVAIAGAIKLSDRNPKVAGGQSLQASA